MAAGSLTVLLLLGALFLLVPGASVFGLLMWSRWLHRRRAAPAFAHWIGYAFVALSGAIVAGAIVWGAVTLVQVPYAGDPARKAAMLGMGISETMNNCGFGFLVAMVGALWLAICSLVWRKPAT